MPSILRSSVDEESASELRYVPTGSGWAKPSTAPGRTLAQPTGVSFSGTAAWSTIEASTTSASLGRTFANPEDKFWSLYLEGADKYDEVQASSWKGDTDGILIFTGLFAATVATCVVQSSQLLSPITPEAEILSQISRQLSVAFNGPQLLPDGPSTPSNVDIPTYAIRVNAMWFLSLALSLCCALAATLMQQWARRYLRAAGHRSAPSRRGPIHVYVSMGTSRFGLDQAVGIITSLLHASVFLYFAGLLDYLFNLHPVVAYIVAGVSAIMAFIYLLLSSIPAIFPDSPFETPLSPFLSSLYRFGMKCAASSIHLSTKIASLVLQRSSILDRLVALTHRLHHACQVSSYSRMKRLLESVREPSIQHVKYALRQVMKNVDEHYEMEQLIDALRLLLKSSVALDGVSLTAYLFHEEKIAQKTTTLLTSCATTYTTLEPPYVRIRRMQTVASFHHDLGRRFGFDSIPELAHDACLSLSDDAAPAIAFLARTMLAESEAAPWAAHSVSYPTLDTRCGYHSHNVEGSRALVNFTRYICVLLHYATLDVEDGPLQMYRALWEPVLKLLREQALQDLARYTGVQLNASFAKILADAGLGGYAPATPSGHHVPNFSWPLARCPRIILDSLRIVAEAYPALPPLPFLTAPSSSSDAIPSQPAPFHSSNEQAAVEEKGGDAIYAARLGEEAFARPAVAIPAHETASPLSRPISEGVWVVVGPLMWGKRPAREFSSLLRIWPYSRREFFPAQLDHCRTLPKREGYVKIFYPDLGDAARFVEMWAAHPPDMPTVDQSIVYGHPPSDRRITYSGVTAEFWDGHGD